MVKELLLIVCCVGPAVDSGMHKLSYRTGLGQVCKICYKPDHTAEICAMQILQATPPATSVPLQLLLQRPQPTSTWKYCHQQLAQYANPSGQRHLSASVCRGTRADAAFHHVISDTFVPSAKSVGIGQRTVRRPQATLPISCNQASQPVVLGAQSELTVRTDKSTAF